MGNDDAKRLILARRARFVAAALAPLAAATMGACAADPEPCLSLPQRPRDAGGDAEPDANPQPCLTPAIEDSGNPQPCLSVAPNEDAGDAGESQ